MAFVIFEDYVDSVAFYTKNADGDVFIITEYIERGDTVKLNNSIQRHMFTIPVVELCLAEKKALKTCRFF